MTTKFLKLGLLTTLSIIPISALTISCSKQKVQEENKEDEIIPNLEQQLEDAAKKFTIKYKGVDRSKVYAESVRNEVELKKYVDFEGQENNFEYTFKESTAIEKTKLKVTYTIKIKDKNNTKDKEFILDGFRDVDWIDYNLEDPADFFKIALDKEHLNTIAYEAQKYNHYKKDMFKTWKLTEDPSRYEATKTNKYFMIGESKYSIYEIKFADTEDKRPIIAQFSDSIGLGTDQFEVPFTKEGAKKNPFLFAVKEK